MTELVVIIIIMHVNLLYWRLSWRAPRKWKWNWTSKDERSFSALSALFFRFHELKKYPILAEFQIFNDVQNLPRKQQKEKIIRSEKKWSVFKISFDDDDDEDDEYDFLCICIRMLCRYLRIRCAYGWKVYFVLCVCVCVFAPAFYY